MRRDLYFKILRCEWKGEVLKVTLQYNEGVEGYRHLNRARGEAFMRLLSSALNLLSEGPWMTKDEG